MTLHRQRPRRRGGFTFIELLVVIGIIALLVSLLAGATIFALNRVDQVKTTREEGGLANSIKQMEADFNVSVPPPSRIRLRATISNYTLPTADQLDYDSYAFLRKLWPRISGTINWGPNGAGGDYVLEGQQCLVFFLGGIQATDPKTSLWTCQGFSTDPANPMNTSVTGRKGPYYTFEGPRLVQPANLPPTALATASTQATCSFLEYLDPYGVPYAYFSSGKSANGYNPYAGITSANLSSLNAKSYPYSGTTPPTFPCPDCPSLFWTDPSTGNKYAIQPYYQLSGTGASMTLKYYNADTFQIISAGKDQKFGPGGNWTPQSGPGGTSPNGADDFGNFYDSRLGATP
jgi:prepilin-type N-terminal cleavage/methylation domain-containing protein